MATKAGTLHKGVRTRLSLPKRVANLLTAALHRTTTEPDPTIGWVARAELGRDTGARC